MGLLVETYYQLIPKVRYQVFVFLTRLLPKMAPHVNTAIKVYKLITNVRQFGHDVVIFYMIIF